MTTKPDRLAHRPFARAAESIKKAVGQARKERANAARKALFQGRGTNAATSGRSEAGSRDPGKGPNAAQEDPSAAHLYQEDLRPLDPHLTDEELFWQEMAGVRPLNGPRLVPSTSGAGSLPRPRNDEEAEVMAELADLVDGRTQFDFSESDEHIQGIASGLDKRLLKKLRQGNFAVQGHLDLHGQTKVQARQSVETFILNSRRWGKRCVLIVHGRRLNSKDQIPVLKENLRVWLAKGRIARSVLAFCSARPSDGGVGAVYVLLRR